jgi:tRNA-2-methylthio-N6-dimethylallyladenosine synthase
MGRTPTNKLVFVSSQENLLGKVLPVHVTWTGPWSMLGELA